MTDSISALWVQQHHDAVVPDSAALAAADARLRRTLWRRDAIEYAAGLLVTGIFAHTALRSDDWLIRIACVAIILGTAAVMHNLWQRRPKAIDPALGTPSLQYHREMLVAQRDSLASVWRWYLAPAVPGVMLYLVAVARASAEQMPPATAWGLAGIGALIVGAVFGGIHLLNRAAARRLQRSIDALDRGEIA
ncbi:hypothetical protein [Sphingomonas sp. M1-B02]|uniref:hypothetical protein n=1 Tax=Sphingomonas sp. M1-B02 TaxID=3114300 RepID=UPI002240CBFA|nr:hypothetical protein [Sphingomonas sp. S6-11]UZK66004.1 hypothetical protein OKW87_16075 [Sphingomonas sp. S6-11]